MATLTNNFGVVTINMTADEAYTFQNLPAGKLEMYITLWLAAQNREVMANKFTRLSAEDKSAVIAVLAKSDVT